MYSMILMAALTTGTDTPDFGRRWGCHGCWGGCWGGFGRGGWGGGYGGYGWGYGGWGGGYGGWGGGYGGWGGGYGGWGGWGAWGGGLGYVYAPFAPTYIVPTAMASYALPVTTPVTSRSMYPDVSANNRATIIVHLPDSASLTVDGKPTTSTSAMRQFYSTPLEPGRTYHYTFQARMERDGRTLKAERTVDVRAGDRQEFTLIMPELNQQPERKQAARSDEKKGVRDRQVQAARR